MLTRSNLPTPPARWLAAIRSGVLLAALALLTACASTQVRTVKDAAGKPQAITGSVVLVEPDIELYSLGAGGVTEPRREWTEAARRLYPEAARQVLAAQGLPVQPDFRIPAEAGADSHLRQIYLLNQAVSMSILQHTRAGPGSLRNKRGQFDWSLGPGVAVLRDATGADYGLFTYIRDTYSTGGRTAMRIIGLLALGGDIGGGIQLGLASLVDLRTGQVVWHNLLVDQTGDLRDEPGAANTASDLLKGIRGASPPPPPAGGGP